MLSTRALGLAPALRQATLFPARNHVLRTVIRSSIIKRSVQTQSLKPEDGTTILNTQRLQRPSSPHFTIYEPQLTWIGSIFNRVTGVGLGFLLYGFSLAYLVAPGTFDSTHVIEFVGGLPDVVKYAGKFILALPFTFHSWNGIRHLLWDSGKFLTVKGAYSTGYAVLGATAISTIVLMFQ
ncbi:SDHC, cytochrome b subunit of succinate dehydrogenase [Lentinula edodes]|uniref:SDHC, cytochrome b subunit of succinate dehydrogenase n=1 Tax=Lentinula lateritia TaxID=40482 RepID=A0A9W9AW43_9AGAR|nr:SDHC, cytochrome b subunit of succinate dehydrogenase [Lentinula edodes]KAJ4491252.1 SDHC, cytochrome b subunit of succinate dehydrogenase [Lentinula edodes]